MSLRFSAEDLQFEQTNLGPLKFILGTKEGRSEVEIAAIDLFFVSWVSVSGAGKSWGKERHFVLKGEEIEMYTHNGLVAKQS